jgi:hypothetical protein
MGILRYAQGEKPKCFFMTRLSANLIASQEFPLVLLSEDSGLFWQNVLGYLDWVLYSYRFEDFCSGWNFRLLTVEG